MAVLVEGLEVLREFGVFQVVIPFILIFALMYGMLSKFSPFGDNNLLNSLISFSIAFIVISFAKATEFINMLIPFITTFFVVILFIVLLLMFMGLDLENVANVIKLPGISMIFIFFFVLFTLLALTVTFPELSPAHEGQTQVTAEVSSLDEDEGYIVVTDTTADNPAITTFRIMTNPVILGLAVMVFMFIVVTYVVTARGQVAK